MALHGVLMFKDSFQSEALRSRSDPSTNDDLNWHVCNDILVLWYNHKGGVCIPLYNWFPYWDSDLQLFLLAAAAVCG